MGRIIRVRRNRGFQGAAVAYDVCIDGYVRASVKNGGQVEIPIDSAPHVLSIALRGKHHQQVNIPAGTDGFGFVVQHQMRLLDTLITLQQEVVIPGTPDGPGATYGSTRTVEAFEQFRNGLADCLVQMSRGQGFEDRMRAANNLYHSVCVSIHSDHVEISYALNKTTNIKEWSTGRHIEKYSYAQLGLTQPAEWPVGGVNATEHFVRQRILEGNPDLALNKSGEFIKNTMHSLF